MRNTLWTITALLSVSINAWADDVYLKKGMVYKNVKVDTTQGVALIEFGARVDTVKISDISMIVTKRYRANDETSFGAATPDENVELKQLVGEVPIGSVKINNGAFIFSAIVGACFAWDQFATASNYSSTIENFEELARGVGANVDVSRLERARTRCYIFGTISALSSIVLTVYAFEPVTVSVYPDKINLSYKF